MYKKQVGAPNFFKSVLKGALFSIIVVLLSVIIFSFIFKITSLNKSVIKPVNQFIKVIAIFIGCYTFVRGERGYLKGLVIGVVTILVSYLLFALAVKITFDYVFFLDILFGGIIGMISGALVVNIKKG